MRRMKSHRPGQRSAFAQSRCPNTARVAPRYRPRLELLEDRVQLGDTLLGLAAVVGLGSLSLDVPLAIDPGTRERAWQHGLFASLETVNSRPVAILALNSPTHAVGSPARTECTQVSPPTETAIGSILPNSGADDAALAGQVAVHRLAHSISQPSLAVPVSSGTVSAGGGAPTLGSGAYAPVALAGSGNAVGHSPPLFAAAPALSFNGSTGQLAIRTTAGEHTVREASTPSGFVDVTLDGQDHTSDPRSAFFDSALAGATNATVTGIRFTGSGQDTLTLGSQHLAGDLTVQATGATVSHGECGHERSVGDSGAGHHGQRRRAG